MMPFSSKTHHNQQMKSPEKKLYQGSERRKHPRIKKNYVLNYFEISNPEKKYEITQLKNISSGGACFVTSKEFSPQTKLGLELKTPFVAEITYLEGHVIQSHTKAAGMLFETRLEFEQLNAHGKFLLSKLMEYFKKEESN